LKTHITDEQLNTLIGGVVIKKLFCAFFVGLLLLPAAATAQIKVGVILSLTGRAASLGQPEKNTIDIVPRTAAGKSVQFIVLDDASDSTTAVKNAKRLTLEDNVDVILGPSTTPNTLAITEVAAETGTPVISVASSIKIVTPMDAKRAWMFKVPQGDSIQTEASILDMMKVGVKRVAYIGFADAYGEGMEQELAKSAEAHHLQLVAKERYAPTENSVVSQVRHILEAKPDAIFIGASGTPAALPQVALKQQGYRGLVYQTNGATNNDYLRVGGKDVEKTRLLVTPMLVAEQLPNSNPSKKPALEFLAAYEGKYGKESRSNFAALAWDAWKILERAIPGALAKASPGTKEFRKALRDEIEKTHNFALNTGVFNYSPADHAGLGANDMVLVTIENGRWKQVR
jgi:branched-chain amino acid transport system substrate-binding protein